MFIYNAFTFLSERFFLRKIYPAGLISFILLIKISLRLLINTELKSTLRVKSIVMNNIILNKQNSDILAPETLASAKQALIASGWVLLRDFQMNLTSFSQIVKTFSRQLTFDPAREYGNDSTQKVNAGTAAVGLHIENGNTPLPPDLVAFYSAKSATSGSQTTVCDGAEIYQNMSKKLKTLFEKPITVSRTLPSKLWRQYVADQHPAISSSEQVNEQHLHDLNALAPNQQAILNSDDSLTYHLTINPCIKGAFSDKLAFANAILGPSFNYETPKVVLSNGEEISPELKQQLTLLAEKFTHEVQWQDGDLVLIDNKRVMHGRRAIEGDLASRQLFIGMGCL